MPLPLKGARYTGGLHGQEGAVPLSRVCVLRFIRPHSSQAWAPSCVPSPAVPYLCRLPRPNQLRQPQSSRTGQAHVLGSSLFPGGP